jgi:asparagine synthase (glutamine-hydrolysing)
MDPHGNVVTFDGRLDNYEDLQQQLGLPDRHVADSVIVLAAFHRWGEQCFSRFVGDWAIALWSGTDRSLYLARDHAGTRTLYFEMSGEEVLWSTYLETFFSNKTVRDLDEGYAAAYLGCQPVRDRTPYQGIRAVLPAHYLVIKGGQITYRAHWDWMVKGSITYKSEHEYDEHFLTLFRQAVDRRTGRGASILAQLSGGMDSASIVCMSDHIRSGAHPDELLDTISFYDDTEPHWNEYPYFSRVEAKRGKVGIHQKASFASRTFRSAVTPFGPSLLPGMDESFLLREKEFERLTSGRQYRVVLSGIGGDEVLGGVPTPLPELADHLVSGRLEHYLKRSVAWCLANRSTLWGSAAASIRFLISAYRPVRLDGRTVPPWLSTTVSEVCSSLVRDDVVNRRAEPGLCPSRVANGRTWWTIMETLPHLYPNLLRRFEYRYPYLDRDLVTFLFTIPREQLVGPGRRRLLMRRALKGIVPDEILERRRKGFCIHGPIEAMQFSSEDVNAMTEESRLVALGLIDPDKFRKALLSIGHARDSRWSAGMIKTLNLDSWLRFNEVYGGRSLEFFCMPKPSSLRNREANKAGTGAASLTGLAR